MSRKGKLKGLKFYIQNPKDRNLPKESRVYKLMFTHLKATEYLIT